MSTSCGLIWIFDNGAIYGDVHDLLTVIQRNYRRRLGEFHDVIIGEVPNEGYRIPIEYFTPDPKREARIRHKANLRRHDIKIWQFEKYLKRNTLDKFTKRRAE